MLNVLFILNVLWFAGVWIYDYYKVLGTKSACVALAVQYLLVMAFALVGKGIVTW